MKSAKEDFSKRSDTELLLDAHGGMEAAFRELMDRHTELLFRTAWRLTGNAADAEEVVQETFMAAFRQLSDFRGQASVKTWLSRIAIRQSAQRYRSAYRHREAASGSNQAKEQEQGRDTETPSEAIGRRIDVRRAMERLSPEHREVIALREFEGMSYAEIAEALEVPRGTVESRLHRARAELRALLKDYLP